VRELDGPGGYHELVLERDRYAREFSMSRVALEHLPDGFGDHWLKEQRYLMTLSIFRLAHELTIDLPYFRYPDGWWQALKERWLPRWLLSRWPVRLKCVGGGKQSVDVKALFPELESPRDKHRVYYQVEQPRFW
jgi:hypothetical protein